ncbi:hypothetical protein [Dyella subtropica]|uniref:hypothetical protein n=1 Tax=Dyella subtropica TaxID=2992127 RepID=UPI0022565FC0|nr:hypothetical protein [Dyella subtropica]
MSVAQPRVGRGRIVAQRLFDIAYAIDLDRAALLWRGPSDGEPARRSAHGATPAKTIAFDVPPLQLSLGAVAVTIDGQPRTAAATARLYDFGAVTLSVSLVIADLPWPDVVQLINAVDHAIGLGASTDLWARLLEDLCTHLAPALTRPSQSTVEEDYLLAIVNGFDQPLTATELQERVDLVPLLSGESRALADSTRKELLGQRFSYYADDLVVLTPDRAFIYEPTGDPGVVDVLEVANAQLLELRYYDALLNDELPRMYDLVAQTRRALNLVAPRRLADLARMLYTLVAEVTELTERVDNALQVTEDAYLARVYTAALELLRVPAMGASVDRKLAIIRDTYAALYDEASASRAGLLELTIILLIVVEIVLAVIRP